MGSQGPQIQVAWILNFSYSYSFCSLLPPPLPLNLFTIIVQFYSVGVFGNGLRVHLAFDLEELEVGVHLLLDYFEGSILHQGGF